MNITKNPFFSVEREPLLRKDGADTGYDALYRKKDGENLSVVSRQYRLVTHRQVMDFTTSVLDDAGIDTRDVSYEMSPGGAKMFAQVKFPEYTFTPDGKSQSLDSRRSGKKDSFTPRVTILNSYDRSSSIRFQYGAYQLVCSNGLYMGHKAHEIQMIHHGDEIEWESFRQPFIDRLTATIEGVEQVYHRLHEADVQPYLHTVLMTDAVLAMKYKRALQRELSGYLTVDYERDSEKRAYVSNFGFNKKQLTAYMLWAALTKVATHYTKSAMARHTMGQNIAKVFTE